MLALICGLILSASAFAQQITVKGHVKDGTGEPIVGATVRITGQQGGVITDIDGNFVIKAASGAEITVSYIGYQDAKVVAAPEVNIVMKEDVAQSLNEVVVIGYGRTKKSDLTGSVTALTADKMVKGAVTSASDMLVGKAAGVSVITDGGAPGSGATIRIRGGSSMSASNNPLIVIGGVKAIARVAEKIVPIMAILYVAVGLVIIGFNIEKIPSVVALIFEAAFNPSAAWGGATGATIATAMRYGILMWLPW